MASFLLLEPCARTRRGIVRVLEGAGHRCAAAGRIEGALDLTCGDRVDLLVADIDALRVGIQCCADLVRRAAPHIRILALSGGYPPRSSCPATCRRCDGMLLKPFEDRDLLAEVDRLLDPAAFRRFPPNRFPMACPTAAIAPLTEKIDVP